MQPHIFVCNATLSTFIHCNTLIFLAVLSDMLYSDPSSADFSEVTNTLPYVKSIIHIFYNVQHHIHITAS